MPNSVAFICAQNLQVRERLDGMGPAISSREVHELMGMTLSGDDLQYCPIILCDTDSPLYRMLKKNPNIEGRLYDVIKEVSCSY